LRSMAGSVEPGFGAGVGGTDNLRWLGRKTHDPTRSRYGDRSA